MPPFLFLSVLAGGDSLEADKLLGKIAGVVIAHRRSNLLNLQIGVREQGGGLFGALFVDKINKADAHFFVEQGRQIIGVDISWESISTW